MLYLVAVLISAIAFGRGPAVLASVAAFVVFDWSFVQPLHQFIVAIMGSVATRDLMASKMLASIEGMSEPQPLLHADGNLIHDHGPPLRD